MGLDISMGSFDNVIIFSIHGGERVNPCIRNLAPKGTESEQWYVSLNKSTKVVLKLGFCIFLWGWVPPRQIHYKQKYSPTTTMCGRTDQGSFISNVRTLTAEDCLGNEQFIGCRLCRRPPKPDDLMFWWVLLGNGVVSIGNWGFGAFPARSSVWCSPAGGFFPEKHDFYKKTEFLIIVECFLIKIDLVCY